jgi:hypothetical protein
MKSCRATHRYIGWFGSNLITHGAMRHGATRKSLFVQTDLHIPQSGAKQLRNETNQANAWTTLVEGLPDFSWSKHTITGKYTK